MSLNYEWTVWGELHPDGSFSWPRKDIRCCVTTVTHGYMWSIMSRITETELACGFDVNSEREAYPALIDAQAACENYYDRRIRGQVSNEH